MDRKKALGVNATNPPKTWVQTERAAHEAWAALAMQSPRAAALLHVLVARMGQQNAVVVSQKTLAKLMGCTERTIRNALVDLTAGNWVQIVRVNGPGTAAAYVVNDRVAWGQPRADLHMSVFSATVIADAEDQPSETMQTVPLRRLPALFPGEMAIPSGPNSPPPSQSLLEGMEPSLHRDPNTLDWVNGAADRDA